MPSLDTNILIRLYLGDNVAQKEAVTKLLRRGTKFSISDLAITEAVYVLEKVYKLSRDEVSEFIDGLLNNQYLNFNRNLFSGGLITIYLRNKSLSFNDCCLSAYAELNGHTPLYTFDKDLAKKLTHAELLT